MDPFEAPGAAGAAPPDPSGRTHDMRLPQYDPAARLPAGHVSVVTGASSGIGAATAELLGKHGSRVLLIGRDGTRLDATAAAIERAGGDADIIRADLSRPDEVRRTAAHIATATDGVDLLVNNAGVILPDRVQTPEGLDTVMAVNHVAPFLLAQKLQEHLAARAPSAVVNLSSGAAKAAKLDLDDLQSTRHYTQFQAYARSKAASLIASARMADNWRDRRICVVSIDPGFVRTGMAAHTAGLLRLANTLGAPLKTRPQQAAAPILSLALWSGRLLATGRLFNGRGVEVKPPKYMADSRLSAELWRATVRMAEAG